jgi:hypothetical protein
LKTALYQAIIGQASACDKGEMTETHIKYFFMISIAFFGAYIENLI